MSEQEQSTEREEETQGSADEDKSAGEKAQETQQKREAAADRVKELEKDPPSSLDEWPSDEGKYITYGGAEGDHSYDEGPEQQLGPASLERKPGGGVEIEGQPVDNPEDYQGEPIPGGPTDPNAVELAGEDDNSEKDEDSS